MSPSPRSRKPSSTSSSPISSAKGTPPRSRRLPRPSAFAPWARSRTTWCAWSGRGACPRLERPPRPAVMRPRTAGVELPLAGTVAAGRPIEAVETPDTIEVPPSMVGDGENFVLRVQGDSMIGDGILDGDYVVVRKQAQAENGQTVVALIGGEATVKRLQRGGAHRTAPRQPGHAADHGRGGRGLPDRGGGGRGHPALPVASRLSNPCATSST